VRTGDTKERVTELLGPPRYRFAKGEQLWDVVRQGNIVLRLLTPESPETWVYGTWRLLPLGPTEDDYAIQFDDARRVARVVFPHKPGR